MLTTLQELGFHSSVVPVLGIFVLCALTVPLRHILVETARPGVRKLIVGALGAIHIVIVLFLAVWFCGSAVTADQCFTGCTLAFLIGCVMAVFQAVIISICLPKRHLSETEKMKLKDL